MSDPRFIFPDSRVAAQRMGMPVPPSVVVMNAILRQAFPALHPECPACHQVMAPYGSHWRCECGHLEERG